MLRDPDVIKLDPISAMIAQMNGHDPKPERLKKGFFLTGGNFNNAIEHLLVKDEKGNNFCGEWPEIKGLENCYGVCDTPEQFIERYEKVLAKPKDRFFIVSLTVIQKTNQSPSGGWRWHKWGPYIGDKKPQCEYLYDEPEIDSCCCFHVMEVKSV